MICSNCSADLSEGSTFCHKCGVKVIPPDDTNTSEILLGQPQDKDFKVRSVSVRGFTKSGREMELAKIRKKFEGHGWTFMGYQDAWLEGKASFRMPADEFNRRFIKRILLICITVVGLFILLISIPEHDMDKPPRTNPGSGGETGQASPRPSQGDYIIVNDLSIGCISQQTFDEMSKYAGLDDKPALAQIIVSGDCEILEKGTPVFAEGSGSFGVIIVRPVGQRRTLYVSRDDIERIR
jgi:hypothetical protein